jgi:hypothetical protein
MSRNDAQDFAQRLYARIPGQYRVYDQEQGQPLLALLTVVGEQVANLRQDLDALWDNFFIETCEEWVVPYLGALVGTNLLPHPVGQSNRLDVWNTVVWRRSKGTPRMLQALAQEIAGWPIDLAEFFQSLGWSQNMNHLRLDHPLTADMHLPALLDLLGHARDPFAHAADFKPAHPLDQPRGGVAAWATPGRYQIRNLGFFARRLATFPVSGATPAALGGSLFAFDPLARDVPLFVKQSGLPLTRAAYHAAPWNYSADLAVRQFGVRLAAEVQPVPAVSMSRNPATFGGAGAGLALDSSAGLRLLNPEDFEAGGAHFTIAAEWLEAGSSVLLGALSTMSGHYAPGSPAAGAGQLVISVRNGFPDLPPSPAGRFPGAVIAVHAARSGPVHRADALYVYLPAGYVTPSEPLAFLVADDGSTYTRTDFSPQALARASEGQVYPPRPVAPSAAPVLGFLSLNRQVPGIRLLRPDAGILVRADVCTADFQTIGAVASADLNGASVPDIPVPALWPANTYLSSTHSLAGTLPTQGLLSLHVSPVSGSFLPESEIVLTNRDGAGLLVYLPEFPVIGSAGADLFVADDGSTYFAPADQVGRLATIQANTLAALPLARASAGQVLPIPGLYPLQQRRPVALDLCRAERAGLLAPGQLGIDPELGRFAFAPGDPIGADPAGLSVDYVEAFSDRVGALNFDRQLQLEPAATRLVSLTGDAAANLPVHPDLASAFSAAVDGDVIEILDSATYAAAAPAVLANAAVRGLTLRAAAGQRPCLAFYSAPGVPTPAGIQVAVPMDRLDLNGIFTSGGPLVVDAPIAALHLVACTLDPRGPASLIANDPDRDSSSDYIFCRSITGPLQLGAGVGRITLADSILDGRGGFAIGDADGQPAALVQLERTTVLGRIHCEILNASEALLDDLVTVEDQQTGCVRFTRFELGSVLPRRFQCVPNEDQVRACHTVRCLAPLFHSLRFGRPDYLQLAAGCPPEILAASTERAEVGAFASALNPIRLSNLLIKLREFMPAGLSAVVIGET